MKFDGIESEIDSLRKYVLTMQAAIHREQQNWNRYVENEKQKLTDEEFAEFIDFQSDTFWELHGYIPRLMRETTFMGIMSLLEHELVGLCRLIERAKKIPVGYRKHKKKTTLESIREYIKTHTSIDIGIQPRWKTLDTFNTIRNAIVHTNGQLSGHKQDQVKYYAHRNHKLLGIYGKTKFPRNRVELKEPFLEHVLDVLSTYSKAAHKQLKSLDI
jgi:hypothetical protein